MDRVLEEQTTYMGHPACRGGYLIASVAGAVAATANFRVSADGRSLNLNGAAVLPAFRGRRIYMAPLNARMALAAQRGSGIAGTQAREGYSEPILSRCGFRDVGRDTVLVPGGRG